jgi:hypothetical protein
MTMTSFVIYIYDDEIKRDEMGGKYSIHGKEQKLNKKFWEELIAYFPLIQYEPHRKGT